MDTERPIHEVIAANLAAWMEQNPDLDTLQKLEKRSGAGYSTCRRAKNGDGNLTVEKLQKIAAAFGRKPADLLVPTEDIKTLQVYEYKITTEPLNMQAAMEGGLNNAISIDTATKWPFEHVSERSYKDLSPTGRVWVQSRLKSAIEEAERQFESRPGKQQA